MTKDAIKNLIKAWQIASEMDGKLMSLGYDNSPYFDISGYISDFIYDMLGEKTDTFFESFTYSVLTDPSMTPDQRADALLKKIPE